MSFQFHVSFFLQKSRASNTIWVSLGVQILNWVPYVQGLRSKGRTKGQKSRPKHIFKYLLIIIFVKSRFEVYLFVFCWEKCWVLSHSLAKHLWGFYFRFMACLSYYQNFKYIVCRLHTTRARNQYSSG